MGLEVRLRSDHSLSSDVSGCRGDVVDETGGNAGERGSRRTRVCVRRGLWSLIAWAGGTGWRRYGAVKRRRRVAEGRGWAGDVDDGRGAGGVEHCCAQEF
jgi:hypothetical protein